MLVVRVTGVLPGQVGRQCLVEGALGFSGASPDFSQERPIRKPLREFGVFS